MKRLAAALYAALFSAGLVVSEAQATALSLFDRLSGTWDVTYEIYDKDGAMRPYHGQATYSRILDGDALQEVWTSDIHSKIPQPYGTTIGFFDAKHEHWTAVWMFPAKGSVVIVRGEEKDGRIVLTGRDDDGTRQRWSIDNVSQDAFLYHFETSKDDGKTWRLVGLNRMQRHGA